MALVYVWCPYCHEGHGCNQDEATKRFFCAIKNLEFTEKQSVEDIKNQ